MRETKNAGRLTLDDIGKVLTYPAATAEDRPEFVRGKLAQIRLFHNLSCQTPERVEATLKVLDEAFLVQMAADSQVDLGLLDD